jgi:adenosylcobinamide amidohydrolase
MKEQKVPVAMVDAEAKVVYYEYDGFEINTLLLTFKEKRRALSTIEGCKKIEYAINTFVPSPLSARTMKNYVAFRKRLLHTLGIPYGVAAVLSTGVSMENLAFSKLSFEDFEVCCLATAGAAHNALRMGVDSAHWVERNGNYIYFSGTINIILLTNAWFTVAAMARAIINVTEAKTAVLQDFNVKSSMAPEHQATGTGTDNVIIVSGVNSALRVKCLGGHTKMGELIAVSTRQAVAEALRRQDGLCRNARLEH